MRYVPDVSRALAALELREEAMLRARFGIGEDRQHTWKRRKTI
jgi:hypothetical protein